MGVDSEWNLWVWLECIGLVSGCCWYIDFLIILLILIYSTCIRYFCFSRNDASLLHCSFLNVNARVGRSAQLDDVVGMFGENTCNASGNRLLSFLNEVELMICNGRKLATEHEWTRIRPSLKQKSIIDYIITDAQLLEVSGNVHVDGTDIGSSDHLLVWMELGRASKTSKKRKRVIRRWRLDRFGDDEVKLSYQNALMAEVYEFSESTKSKIERGMKGQELVNEIVMEWESVVNRVVKYELEEKMIVCGRAARWWDEQIKDKINVRQKVYKKVVNGQEDLWGEYCRLRKEVKQLVIEKKLNIWNELVEKVNTDFDENRKEFWAFVGRKSKSKKKNIASLKSDTGLSLTSTRGKLEVLQRHYQLLSKMSVDSVFDAHWKEEVGDNVKGYSSLSEEVTDSLLDKEIEKGEITKCLRNLKNSKTGGSDGIVGELLEYGGFGMVDLLEQLFSVIWQEEIVPRQWREGLIVNISRKWTGRTLLTTGVLPCLVL